MCAIVINQSNMFVIVISQSKLFVIVISQSKLFVIVISQSKLFVIVISQSNLFVIVISQSKLFVIVISQSKLFVIVISQSKLFVIVISQSNLLVSLRFVVDLYCLHIHLDFIDTVLVHGVGEGVVVVVVTHLRRVGDAVLVHDDGTCARSRHSGPAAHQTTRVVHPVVAPAH